MPRHPESQNPSSTSSMNTMNQIQIRQLNEADIEGFHSCIDAVACERKFLGLVQAFPLGKTRKWLMAGIDNREICLIALDGAKIVGWCDIDLSNRGGFTHAGKLGMGLLKEYRGQELGTRLLKETLTVAKEHGLERVELDVFASNTTAIKFYEKFNFQIEG
jgi:ribosomal protein S18 acetylase RimI-like enzyme